MKSLTNSGRCVAVFPGAFRPPHAAHYAAVLNLVARPNVDEVVVIITNRYRNVPGTTKVLDTDIAEEIWRIFLQDTAKVRVETAPTSAVKHAFGYLDRIEYGGSILFCLGEADFADGDTRFETLAELAAQKGIETNIAAVPTGSSSVRATTLRACLAKKDTGKTTFMSAMPDHLSRLQREKIWHICQNGMQDASTIALRKVRANLKRAGFECSELHVAKPGKPDEVFRAKLADDTQYFIKYANDTVKAANLTDPASLKPRQRLSVERRAIKWLRANIQDDTELPGVVYYSKESKTLMLSEVCPGGHTLEQDLARGVFDAAVARRAARFMAKCHESSGQVNPLWGDRALDVSHWKSMLNLRLTNDNLNYLPYKVRSNLNALHSASDAARVNGFMHLDFCSKNILVGENRIGVIDLEFSCSIGDPAYDLGFFLGHYVIAGICTQAPIDCQRTLQEAISSYKKAAVSIWPVVSPRVTEFAGATILYRCTKMTGNETTRRNLIKTAQNLLSIGPDNIERVDKILCDAVDGKFA